MASKEESRNRLPLNEAIEHAFRTHEMRLNGEKPAVAFIVSTPGAGKTEMIMQYAGDKNIGMLAYEPGLERVEKFGGIPEMYRLPIKGKSSYMSMDIPVFSSSDSKEGNKELDKHRITVPVGQELRTEWSVPQLICEIRSMASEYKEKGVVVLLDDWHLCNEDIQAIGFELFTHYSLNGHKVPSNVTFMLAGNDSSAAGARLQFSAVANRCMKLYSYVDPVYWMNHYAIPNNLNGTLLGFFSNQANTPYLCEEESTTEQFGSPRSWTNIGLHLNDLDNRSGLSSVSDKTIRCILEGSVSKKAAGEFMLYYKIYKNIDVNKLFDKGVVDIPKEDIDIFAYGSAIANELYSRKCKESTKKRNSGANSYSKNFSKALRALLVNHEEIAIKTISQVAMRQERKDKGLVSGIGILVEMARNQEIDSDILTKLPEISTIFSIGRNS